MFLHFSPSVTDASYSIQDVQKGPISYPPDPARRDAPFRGKAAASEKAIRTLFVREVRETTNKSSHVCARARVSERPVSSENEAEGIFQHPAIGLLGWH
jgi:hypothetical protein